MLPPTSEFETPLLSMILPASDIDGPDVSCIFPLFPL